MVRILFGFSEGPAYSTINRTMADWAAPRERGFAVSLGLLSTPLAAAYGYNSIFVASPAATLIGMCAMAFLRPGVVNAKPVPQSV